MCGRFTLTHPNAALAALFAAQPANDLPETPRYNICPTQGIAVVTAEGHRRLRPMRWGLVPPWYKTPNGGPLIINARADTVATKPAFREAIRSRRCLIPASGFYEWNEGANGARAPWYITRADGGLMVFAGLWQPMAEGASAAMVTTDAGPDMGLVHHREPVLLEPADWPLWLGEAGHGAARLMQPQPAGALRIRRVAPAVNSNRAEGAALIVPIEDQPG